MKRKKLKRNKYGAVRTGGLGSKLEAAVYALLLERQRVNEITDIKLQQSVVLLPGPATIRINWKIDFSFIDTKTGELNYAEAKGMPTACYKLKLKMYRALPEHKRLEIWMGHWKRPYLAEVIERGEGGNV